MKIEVAPSFFESVKRIGSFKDKWLSFKGWIRYHLFNSRFYSLLKVVYKTYPWDIDFLYELEKAKIQEMRHHHEKNKAFIGVEYVIRDMKICENLIDIIRGKKETFHYFGDLTYTELENGNYEIRKPQEFKYICDVYVNTKNIDRFIENDKVKAYYIKHPHELYELKAKYLYHKIRYENDGFWWD